MRRVAGRQRKLGRCLAHQLENHLRVCADNTGIMVNLCALAGKSLAHGLTHDLYPKITDHLKGGLMNCLDLIFGQRLHWWVAVSQRAKIKLCHPRRYTALSPALRACQFARLPGPAFFG